MKTLSYWHWILILGLIRGGMHVFHFPNAHDLFGLLITTLVLSLIWRTLNDQELLRPFLLGVSIYWMGNLLDWIDGAYQGQGLIGQIADTYDDIFFAAGFFLIGIAFLRVIQELNRLIERLNDEIAHSQTLQASLYTQAFTDELTGLGNRRALFECLKNKLKAGESGTLLYIDVNNFKPVNDQFGHDVGDTVLQLCAKQLTHQGALAFRLGGDEFVALLAEQDPQRWIIDLSRHSKLLTQQYGVSFSVGLARFSPAQPLSADELLVQADQAMYSDKIARKNRNR